jgi:hypothetical protein
VRKRRKIAAEALEADGFPSRAKLLRENELLKRQLNDILAHTKSSGIASGMPPQSLIEESIILEAALTSASETPTSIRPLLGLRSRPGKEILRWNIKPHRFHEYQGPRYDDGEPKPRGCSVRRCKGYENGFLPKSRTGPRSIRGFRVIESINQSINQFIQISAPNLSINSNPSPDLI